MTTKKIPQVTNEQLRDYELVLVFRPELVDETLDSTVDNVKRLITTKGGEITEVEVWGKRRLAYPINRFSEGVYVMFRCKMRPGVTRELEANLHISEEILRHLLVVSGG